MQADIIEQQIAYYRARAGEYDDWFYRNGRYDHGPEINQQWFDEAALVMRALHQLELAAHTLELACGTGIWTRELLAISRQITAIDAAPEVIALNQQKLSSPRVHYLEQDLFQWQPETTYDLVFFSFWLSHVPPEMLDTFLATVRRALRPGGRLFLIDSLQAQGSTAVDYPLRDDEQTFRTRTLKDGRMFTIVKVFYEPEELHAALQRHGFEPVVQTSGRFFIYACATAI